MESCVFSKADTEILVRTTGRYVTEDTELIGKLRKELADMRISELFEKLQQLGYGKREIKELLDSYFEELVPDGSLSPDFSRPDTICSLIISISCK